MPCLRFLALALWVGGTSSRSCRYTGTKVTQVVRDLGMDCTILQMPNSHVESLSAADFEEYPNLEQLALVNNRIRTVEPGTFDKLKNLWQINLNDNFLGSIALGVFNTIPFAQPGDEGQNLWLWEKEKDRTPYLLVDNNNITDIADGALALPKVSLSHNPLVHLSAGWFCPLTIYIRIENASISSKDEDFHDRIGTNATLEYANNPLTTFYEPAYDTNVCSELDSPVECEALAHLAQRTGIEGWHTRDGWLEGGTFCAWHGVVCDARMMHVVEIHLGHNGLNGTIPAKALEGLYWLRVLDLQNNRGLGGAVPSLASMAALRTLDLGGNSHVGELPAIVNPELRELFLESNNFTGTLPDFYVSPRLSVLQAFENQLEGELPESLLGLAELEVLMLQQNRLSGTLPAGLAEKLTSLKMVSLHSNRLEGIIPNLGKTNAKLTYLHLYENNFTALEAGFCVHGNFKQDGDCQLQHNDFVCEDVEHSPCYSEQYRGSCVPRDGGAARGNMTLLLREQQQCAAGDAKCLAAAAAAVELKAPEKAAAVQQVVADGDGEDAVPAAAEQGAEQEAARADALAEAEETLEADAAEPQPTAAEPTEEDYYAAMDL